MKTNKASHILSDEDIARLDKISEKLGLSAPELLKSMIESYYADLNELSLSIVRRKKKRPAKEEPKLDWSKAYWLSLQETNAIEKYRRSDKRDPLTQNGVDSLIRALKDIEEYGYDIRDAIAVMIGRGWKTVNVPWLRSHYGTTEVRRSLL